MTRATEQRNFNVHPGIIRHLIKEQAGTLVKAVTELVMNSVDAGSTQIDLHFRSDGTFTVKDDGKGFRSRDEIEKFFETFGTPHTEGDAQFGRFRIGRGQIMAFAHTTWRSGQFIMDVRFLDDGAPLGYTLVETDIEHAGCLIEGVITDESALKELQSSGLLSEKHDDWHYSGHDSFVQSTQYITIPIYLAGKQLNTPPDSCTWSQEDEFGYYLFDSSSELKIYNQGIYALSTKRREFGVGGTFVSKGPIKLNMARNSWLYGCPYLENMRAVGKKAFRTSIRQSAQMSDRDLGALVFKIARQHHSIEPAEAEILCDMRFILDLAGKRVSPREFLSNSRFSLYDGRSSLIAERAVTEGRFAIMVPRMFDLAELECNEDAAYDFLCVICRLFDVFITENWDRRFIKFEKIKKSYAGTTKSVLDADLSPRQLAALRALRYVATDISRLTNDPSSRVRKISAGHSDFANGWTNGFDFIWINVTALDDAFTNITGLVSLAVHEFCHQGASSLDEHEHGLEFYKRFHDATRDTLFGRVVRECHLKYMKILLKSEIDISRRDRLTALDMRRLIAKSDIAKAQEEMARKKKWLLLKNQPTTGSGDSDEW
ncbi:ATP-binding protein [Pseudomonas sp. Irchel 3E13]|uniref:ATP-binding protein n=1 Tax=Pseudomonas sp. Irchel 3E13 TaxID=2008975 RepID=UPI002113FC29|nr:ATP-binding protein [Pseudomonas sp. Irchel 3E13]